MLYAGGRNRTGGVVFFMRMLLFLFGGVFGCGGNPLAILSDHIVSSSMVWVILQFALLS